MTVKITDTWLKKQAAPPKGASTYWDNEVKGFGCRIYAPTKRHPTGDRSFFLNYRHDGTERRYGIGSFGVWSAEAARREAKELRRRVDRGEDIAADKRARREAPTVADLAERYFAEHLPQKAPRSQKTDRAMIELEILPVLGARKVASIDSVDIEAMHRALTIKRGVPIQANRVLAVCSKMFALSLKRLPDEAAPWRDQAQGNPCRGIVKNAEAGRTRFYSQVEMAALSEVIAAHPDRRQADCLTLITLTGCRPHEAIEAHWSQFDQEPGFWVKQSFETKQKRESKVPLGPPALELLERIRRQGVDKGGRLFPGLTRLRAWPAIVEAAGLGKGARIYDLRHSFASTGAAAGLSLQVIGRLLGHSKPATTARYSHLADDPLLRAVTTITNTLTGKKGDDNVVPLDRSRK